jgi:hypothetical protein
MLHPALVLILQIAIAPPAPYTSDECLACHDGSSSVAVAYDRSHAWSVDYVGAWQARKASLRNPSGQSGLGSTIENDMLFHGRVECTSCHLPHDVDIGDSPEPLARFRLRTSDMKSLCIACHDSK